MTRSKRLRASAVCVAEGQLLVVRLRDPVSGVQALYPPGGAIEPGESAAEAARRETLEETGLHVRVDRDVELVDVYPFCWAGIDYEVTTHYLAASLEDRFTTALPKVVDAPYNLGASWVPVEEALAQMSIHPAVASAVGRVLHLAKRSSWQKHPHIDGPGSTLLMIHDQFRAAAARLRAWATNEAEPDLALLAQAFVPLARALHHHHHAEEIMLFPFVKRRTGITPGQLVIDHELLTAAIVEVEVSLSTEADRTRARAAVAAFHDVLVTHLDREELLVMPVLLEMPPAEAWAAVHG